MIPDLPPLTFPLVATLASVAGLIVMLIWAPRRLSLGNLVTAGCFLLLLVVGMTGFPGTPLDRPEIHDAATLLCALSGLVALLSLIHGSGALHVSTEKLEAEAEGRRREVARLTGTNVRLEDEARSARARSAKLEEVLAGREEKDAAALRRSRSVVAEAQATARRFRDVFERSVDGMAILERETLRMGEVNDSLRRLTGYSVEDLGQMSVLDLFVAGDDQPGRLDLRRAAQSKRPLQVQLLGQDGMLLPTDLTVSILGTGDDARLLVIFRHSAHRESLERELHEHTKRLTAGERALQEANRQLAERNRRIQQMNVRLRQLQDAKDHFLHTVSHELRTPLTSIRSFSEILLEDGETDEAVQREFLTIIHRESERLTRLVNNVLDLAKIEAGATTLDVSVFDARSVVDDAVTAMTGMARESSVELDLDRHAAALPLRADRDKIQQLVMNLLANAIKFSPSEGEVLVRVAPGADAGTVEVAVTDQGPGIASEDLENVFEKFRQVDDTLTDQSPGTGLGLAICREIAVLHQGDVRVDSVVGVGSTFRVILPAATTEADEAELPVATPEPETARDFPRFEPVGRASVKSESWRSGEIDWSETGTLPPIGER